MLLSIDIGNSSIGFGMFLELKTNKLSSIKKIPSYPPVPVSVYRQILKSFLDDCSACSNKNLQQKEVIISSVVPDITPLIVESLRDFCTRKPVFVNHKLTGGLSLSLKKKKGIGADRIANAAGGYFTFNEPVAVIDCGTASTVTVVGKGADILGGAILPGIGLMQKALSMGTAKLPDISVKKPNKFLGRDTVSAMTTGIIHGTAGAVKHIINGIESELGYELRIILTGGFAKTLSPVLKLHHFLKPNLIFEGMRVIYLKRKA